MIAYLFKLLNKFAKFMLVYLDTMTNKLVTNALNNKSQIQTVTKVSSASISVTSGRIR